MAHGQNASPIDHGDIDPNSSQMIRICIDSIDQTRSPVSSSEFEFRRNQTPESRSESDNPVAEHHTRQGNAKSTSGDTSLDTVIIMRSDQLELLHRRVQQLELSNYGLLKRIYGAQISAAPYARFNGPSPVSTLEKVPESYRYRLYEQYQNMMTTARDPRSLGLTPVSVEGARLLQEYLAQVARLTPSQGEQHHEHRPRSRHKHGRNSSKIDKKNIQAYKLRLDCSNAGGRPPVQHSAALTDYQTQLMLLEEQNQQRLTMMRSQQQSQSPQLFNWIQYDTQLAALQASNEEQLRLHNLSPTSTLMSFASASPQDDVAKFSNPASPIGVDQETPAEDEMAEALCGRPRRVKLPTRERRKR